MGSFLAEKAAYRRQDLWTPPGPEIVLLWADKRSETG